MSGECSGNSKTCTGPKGPDGVRQCPVWVYKPLLDGYFGPFGGTLPNYKELPEWPTLYMYPTGETACGVGPARTYGGWSGPTPNSASARIHASQQPRPDDVSRRCQNCDKTDPPWTKRMVH